MDAVRAEGMVSAVPRQQCALCRASWWKPAGQADVWGQEVGERPRLGVTGPFFPA